MIDIAIAARSALGTPAILTVAGHPAVSSIIVSRDLGDAGSRLPTLRGVPCLVLEFSSIGAADDTLARLAAISAKFAYKETPTRIACSREVKYILRLVRDFDERAIAVIAAYRDEVDTRYAAAQQDYLHQSPRHARH